MNTPSRREFQATLLSFGLIEFLWARDLFADDVKPDINKWFKELYEIGQQLRGSKLKDTAFQSRMEDLYRRVDLETLIKYVELDKIAQRTKLPDERRIQRFVQPENRGSQRRCRVRQTNLLHEEGSVGCAART